MKNKTALLGLLAMVAATGSIILLTFAPVASAHCRIPCGIYDDAARFKMMADLIA